MKRSVKSRWAIENTPLKSLLLIVLVVLVLASAVHAGIADSPLPVLVAGKKTFHVYSVTGINPSTGFGALTTFFSCTSTDKATMQVGVEAFDTIGGNPENDAVATSLSVGPGATVTFGTSGAVGIAIDSNISAFNRGSARILATSKKLVCTAFVADNGNNPPTSMVYLTIINKTTQKGE